MIKIGLVTFYKDNYGSALQCYATKYLLGKLGCQCEVIYKKRNLFEKAIRKTQIAKMQICDSKAVQKKYYLTDKSRKEIARFAEEYLAPVGYYGTQLYKIGNSGAYSGFIAGSDQVWNVSNPLDGIYFLGFAKPEKRMAFAVSLGVDCVPKCQLGKLKSKVSTIRTVTVREEAAQKIIERDCHRKVGVVSDPTVMLTAEEWEKFSETGIKIDKKYIFLHFIDKPNGVALKCLDKLQQELGCEAICFGYKHIEFEKINGLGLVEGSPVDYVSLIAGASMILTDSYHSTLFAIYFAKEFRVFERQYQTRHSQSSRIHHTLRLYGVAGCYNNCNTDFGLGGNRADKMIISQREKTLDALKTGVQILSQNSNKS